MTIKRIFEWGISNPKKLILIDGFAALLSAILLGIVLVKFEYLFGIPRPTLYFLASFPCLFALYDFYGYYVSDKKVGSFLKGIAILNGMYCCISIIMLIYHREKISNLGWIYILTEILIVSLLAFFELIVGKRQIES
ncbi:SID1 transmembrane family member [Membranihabitans marinus]|uniref:SID1 transmembrane family member n=1 Tax=Membranihabitans marinus TaxID=1227546 RepID=UPI001F46A02F|nr:SID1 transmembrane family member [Membranihabitans marinus]